MADRGGYSPLLVGGRPLMSDGTLGEENMFSEPELDWGGIEAPAANDWGGIEPPAAPQSSYDEEFLGRMQSAGAIQNPASADYAPIALGNVMRSRRGLPSEVSSREQSRQDEQLRYRLWDQGYSNANIDEMTAGEYEAKRREFEPDPREQQVYDATTALRKALTADYIPPENQQDWPKEMFDGADNLGEPLNITALKSQLKAAHSPKDEIKLEEMSKKPAKSVGETEQLKRLESLRSEAYQRAQRGKLMDPEFSPKLMEMESLKTELKAKYPDFADEPEFRAFDKETTKWLKRAANANANQFKKDVEDQRKAYRDGLGGDFSGSEVGSIVSGLVTGTRSLGAAAARGAGKFMESSSEPGDATVGNAVGAALGRIADKLQYGNRVIAEANKQAVSEQKYGDVRGFLGDQLPGASSSLFQAAALSPAGMGGMTLGFGATTANDAYYNAKQEGLSEEQAQKHAIVQGGIEMAVMTLFNQFGKLIPGLEGKQGLFAPAAEKIARDTTRKQIRMAATRLAGENIEEVITGALQQVDSIKALPSLKDKDVWTTKGHENDWDEGFVSSPGVKSVGDAMWQAVKQTTLMMGMGEVVSQSNRILSQGSSTSSSNSLKEFMDSPTRRKWEKLPAEIRQTYPLDPKSTEQQRRDLAEKMRSDAESAARQVAGAPDVQAATPADIADEVAPAPSMSDVPLGDDPADSAPPTLSEQDAQEVRDWVESLGVDEILGTPEQPGYLPQLEARENPDEATLLTIQLMREAVAADSEPGVTSEVPETPTTMEGGDPNGQVQEVRQGDVQVQVPQIASPTPTSAGAGIGPAPVVPPATDQPAAATGGTVAEGGDSAPLGSEAAPPVPHVYTAKQQPSGSWVVSMPDGTQWDSGIKNREKAIEAAKGRIAGQSTSLTPTNVVDSGNDPALRAHLREIRAALERGENVPQRVIDEFVSLGGKVPDGYKRKYSDKEPWQMTREEWAEHKATVATMEGNVGEGGPLDSLGYHSDHVAAAIAAGKSVPPNVLAEYPELSGNPPAQSSNPPVQSGKPPKKKSLDDIDSISDDELDAAIAGKKPVPSQPGVAAKPQAEEVGKPASNALAGAMLPAPEPRSTVSARNQREQWIRQSPEAAKPATKERSLSDHFADQLSSGKSYPTILEARKEAEQILGKKILTGTPETKVVDEAVEVGVVKAARKIVGQDSRKDERSTFTKLADLYQRQPKLGTRTSTSMVNQAYSTPAPLAFVASRLADVTKSDTVYEPTAGNGMLLIEADPNNTHANEIDKSRADALREQGFQVTEADATSAQPADKYDVIVMNPPFGADMSETGASKQFVVDGVRTTKRDQVIPLLALKSLKKGGRAVIIIGSPQHQKKTTNDKRQAYLGKNKAFFERLYDGYHVTDHFSVDGGLYSRQGAGFPVDVIVIDGRKDAGPARSKPWQQEPQWFNTWDELGDAKLGSSVRDNLPPPVPPPVPPPKPPKNPKPPKSPPKDDAPPPAPPPPKDDILSDKTKAAEKALADKAREMAKKYGNKTFSLTSLDPEMVKDFYDLTRLTLRAKIFKFADYVKFIAKTLNMQIARQWSGAMSEAWTNLGEQFDGLDQVGNVNDVLDTVEAEIKAENKKDEKPPEKTDTIDELAETEHQVKYESESKNPFSAGTLIPTNQRDAVMESLAKVREAHGDLDKYVAKELKMSDETFQAYFSSEQADALALAIHNYDRNGSALVLADQTGVGKGRVVAGMMRFANLRGLVPVFATEKASLFSDIVRDLTAIGENTGEPPFEFIATNATTGENAVQLENDPLERTLKQGSAVSKRLLEEAIESKTKGGKFVAKSGRGKNGAKTEYKAVFTTYSQVQTVKGAETWKRPAFRRLMPHAFLILDEAHNAGGTEDSGNNRQSQQAAAAAAADRAEFIREICQSAKGVMYSTATWAKRPSTTTLYNRTDMPQAMNGDVDHLPEAIEKGGVPLMQVVSQMLAEAGQLIRREKSFKGVKFEPKTVPVSVEDADKMTSIFREIADRFDPAIEDVIEGVRTEVLGEGGTIAANNATGPQAVTATNFSSMMWNAVDQMLFALKADKAADEAIAAYKAGETPVIAVDATMEAVLDEYLKENQINHGDAINLNFGDILHRYLERSRWYTVRLGTRDAQGNPEKERVRLSDEELNQDTQTGNALEIFKDIAAKIKALAIDAPASPIDWIRFRLEQAGIKVAEVTGRSNVIDYTGKGQMTLGVRDEDEVGNTGKLKTIRNLNSGELGALILNRSGSTGLSIHASKDFKNQKPRHMIIAQAAKNIDEFMQMLGRIHRTGQVVLPRYTLLMSNMPSENRPAAVLSKKLAKLNAAVTAKSKGAVGFDVPDVMNEVGGFVVQQFLQDSPEINDMLGDLPLTFGTGVPPVEWYEDLARKATGKVSILPYANQVEFWDAVSQGFKDRIAQLDALGENPLIAKTLPLDAKTIEKFTLFEGDKDGGPFAQPAELEKVKAKIIGRPLTTEQVHDKLIKFYGMGSMLDFHREQSKWEGKSVYDITNEADAYREEAVKPLVDQAAVTRRLNMIDRQEQAIADAMRQYSPGNTVTVNIPGGELVGVVTDFKRVGKPKNPVQPSSWVVKVAVNDAVKEIDVPVSQISARLVPQSSSMSGILETFDRAQNVSTENRWIATGNLLAAYDRLSNQHVKVTFFTDDQGKTRSGLLLPRSFNATQYLEKRPVVMDTAANALTFLQRGGAALYTPDGVLGVTLAGGQLIFSAPSARSRSGKYTTNPKIRAASLPKEFITPPGSQRTTMIVEGEPAMKKVLAAVLGETSLQANVDRELARAILGIAASGEKIDSDALEKLDDATRSGTDNMVRTEATSVGQNQVQVDAQSTTEADFPTSPGEIIRRLEKLFDVPIRSGGMGTTKTQSGQVLGRYYRDQKIVRRLKQLYGELGVVSHEVGHSLNDDYPQVLKKMSLLARLDLKKLDYDQKQQRPREGFAEFIRRWMTDDVAQLRKDAPDYFKHFEDFLKYNPEAADALNYGRELVNRWRNQTASQRNQAMIRDTREPDRPADDSAGERLRDELNRKRTKLWIDWFDPGSFLKRIDEAVDRAGYKWGPEESRSYDLFDATSMTAANHAYRAVEKGVHSVGEGTEHVYSRGLLDAFEEAKLSEPEKAEWAEWAISKRLLKLREKHGDDYAMPFQLEDIEKVMEDFAGYDPVKQKRFEKLARAVHQFNDDLITMMRDAGLIGELEHDRIINDLDFFLPLERIADRAHVDGSIDKLGLGGMLNVSSPLKRLSPKGSQLPVMHPILSTVYRAIRFYDAAIRQQVTLQMAKQLDPQLGGAKGMGWLMSRVPPSRQPQRLDATKVWEEIKPDLKAQGLDVDAVDPDLLPESITLWKALSRPSHKDMVIRVMVPTPTLDQDTGNVTYEMKPVLYELDEMLHYSLAQMNPIELGSFLTVTKKLGDVLKMGAIGLNPEFALRNAINDWMGYQATATTGKESLTAPVANLAGYGVRKVTGTGTEFDDLYDEHVGNEGSKFGVGVRSPKDIAAKLLRAGDQSSTLANAVKNPLQAIADAKRGLEDLIAMSEVGPRYSEFLSVLSKNGFVLKQDSAGKWRSFNSKANTFERPPRHVLVLAKKAAADIMPFHRRGNAMRKVDALIPLFGAAITGMTKFVQTHRDAAKGVGNARQRLATFYILQMAAELALWAMFGDDDRDEERPEWMLSRHNVLGMTIPRGREWGIPGMLTRGLLNEHSGKGAGISEAALESAKQFIPPHTAPVTVPAEMMADFDFWKMRRIEGQTMQDGRLPADRVKPWTRPAAKWLGENIGGLSPIQWDFAMDRLSGGMTGRLQDEAKDIKEGRVAATIPFASGIVEKREYVRSIDDLYDALGHAKQVKGSGEANKTLTQDQYSEFHKLNKGASLVGEIRKLANDKDAAVKDQYEKYADGAARFFLGKPENKRYPNPLTATDAPAEIKDLADKLKFSVVQSASEQLSSEDHKRDKFGKLKSDDRDDTILASRELIKEIAPTYDDAWKLMNESMRARRENLTSDAANARRARIKRLY